MLRVAVPLPEFADYLRLGTAQIRRSEAKERAVAGSLIQLWKDVGGRAVSEERRGACTRHLWLVLEDAKRETAQPTDVEAVQADGAAAPATLGTDRPSSPTTEPAARTPLDILPLVCREAWSAASDLQPEEPSMPARAHRAVRIVTHRRPATAPGRAPSALPSMRRWPPSTRPLRRLLQADLGYAGT